MRIDVRSLIDRLVALDGDGSPAVVLVDDYAQRADLLCALEREAEVHGITLEAQDQADGGASTRADRDQALAILVNAGKAQVFGEWLDAYRDRLPTWARFVLVFVLQTELAMLLQHAPAFFSLVKGRIVQQLVSQAPTIPAQDVQLALAEMSRQTGQTPAQFVEAWRRGEVPDTFQNNYWVNLALLSRGDVA